MNTVRRRVAFLRLWRPLTLLSFTCFIIIIIIIIHEFHRDASLEHNFSAAMCHELHYSCCGR